MAGYEIQTHNWFITSVLRDIYAGTLRKSWVLGAGASVESGIPDAAKLAHQWSCELQALDPVKTDYATNILGWVGSVELRKLSKDVERRIKPGDWAARQFLGENYFDIFALRFSDGAGDVTLRKAMAGKTPSLGYFYLAQLLSKGTNMVITVNFDNLVADALYLTGERYPIILDHESTAHFIDPTEPATYLCKVHRSFGKGAMNSADDLKALDEAWETSLDRVFGSFPPIFLGYGGNDQTLMNYLQSTKISYRPIWLLYSENLAEAKNQVPEPVAKFLTEKNGILVPYSGFDRLFELSARTLELPDVQELVKAKAATVSQYLETKVNELANETGAESKKSDPIAADRIELAEKSQKRSVFDWIVLAEEEPALQRRKVLYDEAISEHNNNAWLYHNRGIVKRDLHGTTDALADYDKAIELEPNFAHTYNARGNVKRELGDTYGALADYNKAIELDPNLAHAYNGRGIVRRDLGDKEGALTDYNKAQQLDPNSGIPWFNKACSAALDGDTETAVKFLAKAIELETMFREKAQSDRDFDLIREDPRFQALINPN